MTIANESGGKQFACSTCNDTHYVWNHRSEATQMCTHCPTPCDKCRQLAGAFCGVTPCDCECHRAAIPQEDGAREVMNRGTITALAAIITFQAEDHHCALGERDAKRILDAITSGAIPGVAAHSMATLQAYIASENELRASLEKMRAERGAALGRYADAAFVGDRLKAECAGLRALLSVARDSVEFEVQEKHQNWGDRLMHKQQGAIDLLAKITAAITPTPAAERGGEQP
jgi:hypothetical protein